MPKQTNLVQLFNKTLRTKTPVYRPKAKAGITASSLGSPCKRRVYYDYSKAPKECGMPLKVDRIMHLGNVVGEHLTDTFRQAGVVVDYLMPDGSVQQSFGKDNFEFPIVSPALGVRFSFIDMVFIADGRLQLAEFKSINDKGYGKLQHPQYKHVIQSVLYFHVFNKMLQQGAFKHIKALDGFTEASDLHLLYYNKNTSFLKQFVFDDTTDVFRDLVSKIVLVRAVETSKILPEKAEDFCQSCPYAKRCAGDIFAPRDGGAV